MRFFRTYPLFLILWLSLPLPVTAQQNAFDPFKGADNNSEPREIQTPIKQSIPSSTRPVVTDHGDTIGRLQFEDQEISMIFQVVSDASGWSIFPSSKVRGKITLYARDISALDLLDQAVTMAGFVYVRQGNIVNVMTYDEYMIYYGVVKRTIKLNNRRADEVVAVLQPFVTLRGKLLPDPPTGMLVIYEVPTNLLLLEEVIRKIDVPADRKVVEVIPLIYSDATAISQQLLAAFEAKTDQQKLSSVLHVPVVRPGETQPAGLTPSTFLSAEDAVVIQPIERTNHLLLRGYSADIARIKELVVKLDIPSESIVRSYQIVHLPAADISDTLQEALNAIIGNTENSSGGGGRGGQRSNIGGGRGSQGGGTGGFGTNVRIGLSVLEESNAVVVTAPFSIHKQVVEILASCDRPLPETAGGIKSYRLENAQASDVAKILQDLINRPDTERRGEIQLGSGQETATRGPVTPGVSPGTPSAAPPSPGPAQMSPEGLVLSVSGERRLEKPRVAFSETTNSVIIQATVQEHIQFAQLIKELDRRLDQVLLEVIIVEIRGNEDIDIGVEVESFQPTTESAGHLVFTSFGLSTIDPLTGVRTIATPAGGTAAVVRFNEVPLIVHALQNSGKARIRSAPRILVNDNAQGRILSIAEEPFSQINASQTVATTSFGGFVQAGTQLVVTPHVSEDDYLRLEYEITLNSFRGPSADPSLPPARDTSTISSHATLPDGDTLIVGGLNSKTTRESEDKLPLAGDIPLLGALFRRTTKAEQEVRIYVFVSPVVIRSQSFRDLRSISETERHEAEETAADPQNASLDLAEERTDLDCPPKEK